MRFFQVFCATFALINCVYAKGYGIERNIGSYGEGLGGYGRIGASGYEDGFGSYRTGFDYGPGAVTHGVGYSSYGPSASFYRSKTGSYGRGIGGYGPSRAAYGAGSGDYGVNVGSFGNGGYGHGTGSGSFVPKPYSVGYGAPNGYGSAHFHREEGDASGNVRGSYGYTDQQGLFRQVDYLSGADGFKASVKTNEPGTNKQNPADVNLHVQKTPTGIQDKYSRGSSDYPYVGFGSYGVRVCFAGIRGNMEFGPHKTIAQGRRGGFAGPGDSGHLIQGYGGITRGSSGYSTGLGGNYRERGMSGWAIVGGPGKNGLFSEIPRSSTGKSGF